MLLNNASQPGRDLHVREQTLENWNDTIAADVTGPMLCTREVLRQSMIERRRGSIVNFSSTAPRGDRRSCTVPRVDDASAITGQSLIVDAGVHMYG